MKTYNLESTISHNLQRNITYRKSTIADAEQIVKWRNQENIYKWFINRRTITLQEHINWFNNNVLNEKVIQFIFSADEKDIGVFSFGELNYIDKNCEYEIYIGEQDFFGKGIGTLVTKSALKIAFNELNMHKVYLRVYSENIGAVKAYRNSGFTVEGVLKEQVFINNKYFDIIMMSVINEV
ncbi:MAG: UDP-4-amino-4,6-dideoxy-N-acetyl-beta-L-altrosamine N-acetyltransferase [Oscillospiraceae bacterium]|nr:UDP-4-amino-4,6-dideoxy-N-acetyl-beta-L-altrosamine N-acetyltransferase [Oscillospiraceae bacterium]